MKKRKVIFVVEDDPGFNKLMTTYLTAKDKWKVYSFDNGEDSIEHLDLAPDIFLEDFDLPLMNGIQVMKIVKEKLPETEFIFLSGQSDIKVALEAIQTGAFDYIVKDTNARANALNKIDQIVKIKNLEEEKKIRQKSLILIISIVVLLWGFLLAKIFFF